MLAGLVPGALVTIRAIGGGRLTGRAIRYRDATTAASLAADQWAGLTRPEWCIVTGSHSHAGVTADNIIGVQPA